MRILPPTSHFLLPTSYFPLPSLTLAIKEFAADKSGTTTSRIVYVHENRVAPLLANALILASIAVTPVFGYIPTATLDGLFLFM